MQYEFGKEVAVVNLKDTDSAYCVYAHVNKINGKVYIGITYNFKRRVGKNGNGYSGCTKFYSAIQKYGWDNFLHIVLMEDLSIDMACEIEKALIQKYDTINNGYNISKGGIQPIYNKKIDSLLKPVYQYDLDGNYIDEWRCVQDAQKALGSTTIYQCCDGYIQMASGYLWSYEKVSRLGKYAYPYKHYKYPGEILQINPHGNVIATIGFEEYKLLTNRDRKYITNCLSGDTNCYNGFFWVLKDNYSDQLIQSFIVTYHRNHLDRTIYQYAENGEFLTEYCDENDAELKTGVKKSLIRNVCNMRSKLAGGYQWRFARLIGNQNSIAPYVDGRKNKKRKDK